MYLHLLHNQNHKNFFKKKYYIKETYYFNFYFYLLLIFNQNKLNFDINKFKKFEKKIHYLIVDDIPKDVTNYKKGWSPNFFRENFNRNAISRALTECSPSDLIIISDADEIPNLELLVDVRAMPLQKR